MFNRAFTFLPMLLLLVGSNDAQSDIFSTGCTLTCPNGERHVYDGCFYGQATCYPSAFSGDDIRQKCNVSYDDMEISSKVFVQEFRFPGFSGADQCTSFLNDFLKLTDKVNTTNSTSVNDVAEAQCGCTDLWAFLTEEIFANAMGQQSFCDAAIKIAASVAKKSYCGKKGGKGSDLLSGLCGTVINFSASATTPVFNPLCKAFLGVGKVIDIDVEKLYSEGKNVSVTVVDKIGKAFCGQLTCKSTEKQSAICKAINSQTGQTIIESVTGRDCATNSTTGQGAKSNAGCGFGKDLALAGGISAGTAFAAVML
ncbi:hypothetical protein BKA69DRAFT_1104520 [Paraphysoderma sedebokerense]|nr:hypothetical protein BKA69DRAFT_1104520 [Paraphysoderma sedebokerense]